MMNFVEDKNGNLFLDGSMSGNNAITTLYVEIGGSFDSIEDDVNSGYLSENTGRNSGRTIWWYLDNEKEAAIYEDDLSFLTPEEIESELC